MSRYFDDELTHSGVKGMKWRKHKYRLVKDANGKLRYVYDNDNTGTGVGGKFDGSKQYFLGPNPNHTTRFSKGRTFIEKDSPVVKKRLENDRRSDALNEKKNASANRLSKSESKQDPHARQERRINEARAKRAEKKDKDIGKRSREYIQDRRSNTGTKPLTETYLVPTKTTDDGLLRTSKLRSTVLTGRSGEKKQREEKREATRYKKEIERIEKRKAEANKAQHVANNQKAKATGKRASWAPDKPYQSRVEYDQENQRDMLKERDYLKKHGGYHQFGKFDISGNKTASQWHDEHYKNQKRWTTSEMEGFYANRADIGQRSRAAESTARHKAAVKAQKKKKFTDTIDKGRKAAINKYVGEHAAQKYNIEKTRSLAAIKRRYADDWRKTDPSIESVTYDNDDPYSVVVQEQYHKGDSNRIDRFRHVKEFQHEPSKETKKRLRRNKRKKIVADTKRTIDKGRKAVEEFFTPKKKKKR